MRALSAGLASLWILLRWQQAGELLVALEQEFHALRVAGEGGFAVAGVHGAVERLMGFDQRGRHRERVVEVGQRALRKLRAGIQHGLRGILDFLALRVAGFVRPREVVVHDARRIAVTAFQTSAGVAHPGHVHCRGQNAEVVERGVGNDKRCVTGQRIRVHETNWHEGAAL